MHNSIRVLVFVGVLAALAWGTNEYALRAHAQSASGTPEDGPWTGATGRSPAPLIQSPFQRFTALPLYLQTSPPWNDDAYGAYPDEDAENTIARWGCFTTSAAMVVNYYGETLGFQATPDAMNAWLRASGGYTTDNGGQLPKVIEYARENRVPLAVIDRFWGMKGDRLDAALEHGNLAILGVEADSHYVVAYRKLDAHSAGDYAIHDPLYGRTTLAKQWGGAYSSAVIIGIAPEWQQIMHLALPSFPLPHRTLLACTSGAAIHCLNSGPSVGSGRSARAASQPSVSITPQRCACR